MQELTMGVLTLTAMLHGSVPLPLTTPRGTMGAYGVGGCGGWCCVCVCVLCGVYGVCVLCGVYGVCVYVLCV